MDHSYETLSLFALSGGTGVFDQTRILTDTGAYEVIVSAKPRQLLAPFARSLAIRSQFALPQDMMNLDVTAEEQVARLVERASPGSVLAFLAKGQVTLNIGRQLRSYGDLPGGLDVVEVTREPRHPDSAGVQLPTYPDDEEAPTRALAVAAVLSELGSTATELITCRRFFIGQRETVPLRFVPGSSTGTQTHKAGDNEILAASRALGAVITSEATAPTQLFVASMQPQPEQVAFLTAWVAIERLVHAIIKERGLTADGHVNFIQKLVLVLNTFIADPDAKAALESRVRGLKKQRDLAFHTGNFSGCSSAPAHTLFRELFRLYLLSRAQCTPNSRTT